MDTIKVYNKSNNTHFYASLMTPKTIEKVQIINGLKKDKFSGGLRINGICKINIGDILVLFGNEIKVKSSANKYDSLQFRFRKDYFNFTGRTEVLY